MLKSHHKNLWGGAIDIGGTIYNIDANGYLQGAAPDVEAGLLAQHGNWYDDKAIPKLGGPVETTDRAPVVPVSPVSDVPKSKHDAAKARVKGHRG